VATGRTDRENPRKTKGKRPPGLRDQKKDDGGIIASRSGVRRGEFFQGSHSRR